MVVELFYLVTSDIFSTDNRCLRYRIRNHKMRFSVSYPSIPIWTKNQRLKLQYQNFRLRGVFPIPASFSKTLFSLKALRSITLRRGVTSPDNSYILVFLDLLDIQTKLHRSPCRKSSIVENMPIHCGKNLCSWQASIKYSVYAKGVQTVRRHQPRMCYDLARSTPTTKHLDPV